MFNFLKKSGEPGQAYLPKPRDILQTVGQTLVVSQGSDPDWVWKLKCVVRGESRQASRLEFRVFDAQQASSRGVKVENYPSLDQHPDLVLFHGWLDNATNKAEVLPG